MDRDKLIERARKLFAMSQDSGSPVEAAIADRRLSALMEKHGITLEQIKGTEPEFPSPAQTEEQKDYPVRRKRRRSSKRSSSQPKETRTAVRLDRVAAVIAMCGVGLALIVWQTFSGIENNEGRIAGTLAVLQSEKSPENETPFLSANVERASLIEDESVVLFINGSAVSKVPDTSSLASDFIIIDKQLKTGANKKAFQLRMLLQPRKTGVVFIPSLSVDGVRSEGIILNIVPRTR